MNAISLFSNCGAGDLGYARAGFAFRVLAELVPKRLEVALANHDAAIGVEGDLRETWPKVLEAWTYEEPPHLLCACPPCQGMSSARGRRGAQQDADAGAADARNLLVMPIAQVALALRPRVIVVENVPAFLTRLVRNPLNGSPISAARLLCSLLQEIYECFPLLGDLADWGIPQRRRRCFLTFVRRDDPALAALVDSHRTPYPALAVSRAKTLGAVLADWDLTPLDASDPERAADPQRPLHFVPVWDEARYRMVSSIPPWSGASAWENSTCRACGETHVAPQQATCPGCGEVLDRPVITDREGYRLVRGFRDSSYRRLDPYKPAATVTTASGNVGSDRTIHPWENRVLSPLECARLQTIPDDFDWASALSDGGVGHIRAMIGEAVPPAFTEIHGQAIASLLAGKGGSYLLDRSDKHVASASAKLWRAASDQ